jgi:hypothetical protein
LILNKLKPHFAPNDRRNAKGLYRLHVFPVERVIDGGQRIKKVEDFDKGFHVPCSQMCGITIANIRRKDFIQTL